MIDYDGDFIYCLRELLILQQGMLNEEKELFVQDLDDLIDKYSAGKWCQYD